MNAPMGSQPEQGYPQQGRGRLVINTGYNAMAFLLAATGPQVPVFYRPPAAVGMAGSIGFEPQTTRGMVAMMVISWGTVAVVLLVLVVSLLV